MEIITLLTILFTAHKDPVTRVVLRKLKKMFNALLEQVEELENRAETEKEKYECYREKYDNLWDDYNQIGKENCQLRDEVSTKVLKYREKLDKRDEDILDFNSTYVLCIVNYERTNNFIPAIKVIREYTEYHLKLTKDIMDRCCQISSVPVVISKHFDSLTKLSKNLGNLGIKTTIWELGLGNFITENTPVDPVDPAEEK